MSIVLALTGLALLLVALVMFVRTSKTASEHGATTNRRAIVVLTLLGLALGLASQLPAFRG
ncbi:hypothetical protein ACFQRL_09710 [Microbacterium fluvii]|uniref:Uncharacterized protein n=1 Tax=Microbacterium fluvii TaxID=415215 RepID=A0ABW2HD96_9MICO|nr:hypothetical protein [Microbacterium fluvii]MCU4672866.1 hypothetical protein [Microbacterium fluvii]